MGSTVTLTQILSRLDSLSELSTIYVAEPWSGDSVAIIAEEPDCGGLPPEAQALGLKYFLEVSVARDFLEGWFSTLTERPPSDAICKRLVSYAITDA